jgi:hypothetical protein
MLYPYWNYRDELSIQDGIIYKGPLAIVPTIVQSEMLQKIHINHFGAESNIRMAREVLFWQGMRQSIQDMCEACSICAQYGSAAPQEPMMSLPIPTLPWQLVSQDILKCRGKYYLVTVCHFSDWIEVDQVEDTLSTTIIAKTRVHFSRFGIPNQFHTDNGPQYISREYRDFVEQYGFRHTTSSPYHSQGNGRAEAAVKVSKKMLKKCKDFNLAMLNYRNTPPKGHTYSPAQRMLCRHSRTLLPTSNRLLAPQAIDMNKVVREIRSKREASKVQYDKKSSSELAPLTPGAYAYVKPAPNRRGDPWAYGRVTGMNMPRSIH